MPHNYAVRITHSYEDCKHIVACWAMECDKMAVYEHIGSETEKVHIHMIIVGSRIQKKQLRNKAAQVSQVPLKGNENCSFKDYDGNEVALTYMTKGNLTPKYLKGYTVEDAHLWNTKWVEPTPKQEKISEIKKVYTAEFSYDLVNSEWRAYNESNSAISIQLFLRRKAHKAAMKLNKGMITPKCSTDARTLYITYCYNHGVKIDKKDPYYKYITWENSNQQFDE